MSLSPSTWEDVIEKSRVALLLPHMSVSVSVSDAKTFSYWSVTSDGPRVKRSTAEVVLNAGFKDLAKKFPHRYALIQHPNPKGRFEKRDYNGLPKKFPAAAFAIVSAHGYTDSTQWICAFFKDTAEGRRQAAQFKLTYA